MPNLRRYLVECYWSGVTEPRVAVSANRAQQAAVDLTGAGSEIRYLTTLLVPDDEVAFCLFAACSVATVEEVCRRAELPVDRIQQVVQIG